MASDPMAAHLDYISPDLLLNPLPFTGPHFLTYNTVASSALTPSHLLSSFHSPPPPEDPLALALRHGRARRVRVDQPARPPLPPRPHRHQPHRPRARRWSRDGRQRALLGQPRPATRRPATPPTMTPPRTPLPGSGAAGASWRREGAPAWEGGGASPWPGGRGPVPCVRAVLAGVPLVRRSLTFLGASPLWPIREPGGGSTTDRGVAHS